MLELARDGADLKAVVSFHGVLAPSDQVAAFENEMRAGKVADWQVISYGNTLHGFANPAADGSIMKSALYDSRADRRSWAAMQGLFDEVLV
ncbi:dienelactone hydrolase [Bradyrhizobium sp. USDA 4011]